MTDRTIDCDLSTRILFQKSLGANSQLSSIWKNHDTNKQLNNFFLNNSNFNRSIISQQTHTNTHNFYNNL